MYLKDVSTVTVTRAETYLLKARSDFLLNSLRSTLREAKEKKRERNIYTT